MPNLNDFYAFKSTSSGKGSTEGLGCLSPVLLWVFVIATILKQMLNVSVRQSIRDRPSQRMCFCKHKHFEYSGLL